MSSALPQSETERFGETAAAVEPAVSARNVSKTYIGGDGRPLQILDGVDLDVAPGEAVSVIGRSGSGKSTLLQVLGGLDAPNVGVVTVGGRDLARLGEEELARLRAERIGFVFQFHHLLREFSALENVMMPQLISGTEPAAAKERARELLDQVGLTPRLHHKPAQLSGGEQQRVAVARALANRPQVVLADEPTGSLDPRTAQQVLELIRQLCREVGASLLLVSHDPAIVQQLPRNVSLADLNRASAA